MLLNNAREYRQNGILESIRRNNHMNNWNGRDKNFDIDMVDAILTDFINYVASFQGVDYGLNAVDLYCENYRERKEEYIKLTRIDLRKAEEYWEEQKKKIENLKLRKQENEITNNKV